MALGRYATRKNVTPSRWTQTLGVAAAIAAAHLLVLGWFVTRPEPEPEMREFVTYYDIAVYSQAGTLVPLAGQTEQGDSVSGR